ncbi:putative serine/threonine-protein kinase PBL19 [Carex rostrata]
MRRPDSQAIVPITSSSSGERTSSSRRNNSFGTGLVSSERSIPRLYEEKDHNLRQFTLKELSHATFDFNKLLKIGEGGFGSVYKGFINNRDGIEEVLAIKRLNPYGLQGHKQWLAEVQFLGVVEHKNLVELIGYCAEDTDSGPQRLLVYEFIPNRTLDDHLFNKAYPCLPWHLRLQIALGAAEGLSYLHEGLEVQVIYRDFKASNVLLDDDFRPKLSDFGLAREGPTGNQTHVSTAVMGTKGYAAPDYIETGHLTVKSDVWSFGVVLYEILTGRRSVEKNRPKNEQRLLEWVKRYPPGSARFAQIIDPRLENKYSMKGAQEIAQLANLCLSKSAKDRPKMSEVKDLLRRVVTYEELDGETEPCSENTDIEVESETESELHLQVQSVRRRMLHLAKLRESTGVDVKRRLALISKVGVSI